MELSDKLYAPGALTPVPTEQEVGWAPETVWKIWKRKKPLDPTWTQTPDRPVRSTVTVLTAVRGCIKNIPDWCRHL
jgi:hypothetical protein